MGERLGLCPKSRREPEVYGLPDSLRAGLNKLEYTMRYDALLKPPRSEEGAGGIIPLPEFEAELQAPPRISQPQGRDGW